LNIKKEKLRNQILVRNFKTLPKAQSWLVGKHHLLCLDTGGNDGDFVKLFRSQLQCSLLPHKFLWFVPLGLFHNSLRSTARRSLWGLENKICRSSFQNSQFIHCQVVFRPGLLGCPCPSVC
jgi:hypothetical protein